MDVRRISSSKRKLEQALSTFESHPDFSEIQINTSPRVRLGKASVECEVYFLYKGDRYRFDYEFSLDEKLPGVNDIRGLMWSTLHEYRSSKVRVP